MRVTVVTPPEPIVTFAEAQRRLRDVADSDQDDVEQMIAAATAHIDGPDGWLGRALGPQVLEARIDSFDQCRNGSLFLPCAPIIEIVSVYYVDGGGTSQIIDPAAYDLIGSELVPAWQRTWPAARGGRGDVRIRYRAGYVRVTDDGEEVTVPAPIIAALLLMVGDLYQNRETTTAMSNVASVPMPTAVDNLLAPYRVWA